MKPSSWFCGRQCVSVLSAVGFLRDTECRMRTKPMSCVKLDGDWVERMCSILDVQVPFVSILCMVTLFVASGA